MGIYQYLQADQILMKNKGGTLARQMVKLCRFNQSSDFSDTNLVLMEHASIQHYSFIKLDVAGGPLSIINAFISDELLK